MMAYSFLSFLDELKSFSNASKFWIYFSDRSFTDQECKAIQIQINSFCEQWKSHGREVMSKGFIILNQIIILVADESQAGVSGCSADSSVHFVKSIGSEYHINFFDRNSIWQIENDELNAVDMQAIKSLANEAIVFNPFYKDLAEFRNHSVVAINESKYRNLL
jgi:hypothetical protein